MSARRHSNLRQTAGDKQSAVLLCGRLNRPHYRSCPSVRLSVCHVRAPKSKSNKSPAVARVRRPYSWCTLATCVHNCPTVRVWCFEHVVACARYLLEILALQIAAKQLQLATWLLLTAYRNLPTPYPTVPSPTLYDVSFSHNTKRYRQTDDRQTTDDRRTEHRTISATVLPSKVG